MRVSCQRVVPSIEAASGAGEAWRWAARSPTALVGERRSRAGFRESRSSIIGSAAGENRRSRKPCRSREPSPVPGRARTTQNPTSSFFPGSAGAGSRVPFSHVRAQPETQRRRSRALARRLRRPSPIAPPAQQPLAGDAAVRPGTWRLFRVSSRAHACLGLRTLIAARLKRGVGPFSVLQVVAKQDEECIYWRF